MRKTLIAGAVLSALSLAGGTAHADNAVARVTGNGTISPGLSPTVCSNQTVTFSGTGVVDSGSHAGTYNFTFAGSSSACETTATGGGCGQLAGDISGTVCYTRNGNVVQVTGNVTFGTTSGSIQNGTCVFVPTSAAPTTTYTLACTVVLTH